MNTTAGIWALNWFRGSKGKIGFGGARCFFTTKRDSYSSLGYHLGVGYTNVNLKSCVGSSPISILRRPVIASLSPSWIQIKNFYVVRKGRIPGIYDNWEDCKSQVQGFHDNEYKKFSSIIEANEYLAAHRINSTRCMTKKAFVEDLEHGQDAYKKKPEEPLAKATASKRSRKKVDETESNEGLCKASSALNKPLGNSSKSEKSRKEADAAGSNKIEEPLAKATKLKRSRKKLDETKSNEARKSLIASSAPYEPLENSSKSTRRRKEANAADSNEDLLQATSQPEKPLVKANKLKRTKKKLDETESNGDLLLALSQPEEPLVKANRSKKARKKLDEIESSEELLIGSSSLNKPLGNSSKSTSSRKQAGAAHSNEDLLQVCSQLEEPPAKMTKTKRTRKKLYEAESNKDLLQVSPQLEEPTAKMTKTKRIRKKLYEPESNEDLLLASSQLEEPPAKMTKTKRTRKKPYEPESNEELLVASSPLNKPQGSSSKSTRSKKQAETEDLNKDSCEASSSLVEPLVKFVKSRRSKKIGVTASNKVFYDLEFDGASKGNPGKAGAGALLRSQDGKVVYELREGVGYATNNVAEYRAVILGLKVALSHGISEIHVKGDSKLVCKQIKGLWQTKNENMAKLCAEAKQLKTKFKRFHIEHVLREFNSDADALANAAINLRNGEWLSNKVELQDSSDTSSFVKPLKKFDNSRSSEKIDVIDFNKDLFQVSENSLEKISKSEKARKKLDATDSDEVCYQLEFDGASKGNPGRAGAGALLRNQGGKVVYKLREGVGFATCNVAEYRAVILGLKVALSQGISQIHVQGDSKLVCMQIKGLWKTKSENMAKLCAEAVELKTRFKKFYISHVEREFNSDADALANAAINLQNGEWHSNKVGAQRHGA